MKRKPIPKFGRDLCAHRERIGITQTKLAEASGVARRTIVAHERGERTASGKPRRLQPRLAERIADVLGLDGAALARGKVVAA